MSVLSHQPLRSVFIQHQPHVVKETNVFTLFRRESLRLNQTLGWLFWDREGPGPPSRSRRSCQLTNLWTDGRVDVCSAARSCPRHVSESSQVRTGEGEVPELVLVDGGDQRFVDGRQRGLFLSEVWVKVVDVFRCFLQDTASRDGLSGGEGAFR